MPAMEPASLLRFLRKLKEVFDVCDEDADGFIRVEHFVALGLQFGQGDEVSAATAGPRATFTCRVWSDPAPSPTCPHRCPRPLVRASGQRGSAPFGLSGAPPVLRGALRALPLAARSPFPQVPPGPSAAFPLSRGAFPKDSPAPSFPGWSRSIPRPSGQPRPLGYRGWWRCLSRGVFILCFVRPG